MCSPVSSFVLRRRALEQLGKKRGCRETTRQTLVENLTLLEAVRVRHFDPSPEQASVHRYDRNFACMFCQVILAQCAKVRHSLFMTRRLSFNVLYPITFIFAWIL